MIIQSYVDTPPYYVYEKTTLHVSQNDTLIITKQPTRLALFSGRNTNYIHQNPKKKVFTFQTYFLCISLLLDCYITYASINRKNIRVFHNSSSEKITGACLKAEKDKQAQLTDILNPKFIIKPLLT